MSAPPKPWETNRCRGNQNMSSFGQGSYSGRNVLSSNCPQLGPQPMVSARTSALPPLPPRPPQLTAAFTTRPAYAVTPGYYGGGYSGYTGYGGYSSYGGNYPGSMYLPGGYGYASYGQPAHYGDSRFLQAAEESSRNAFQSIESLVHAFTSVSMMLESTYHAMYSSFRAVLGVVDNFSRLRQMFAQFLSAITFFRIIKSFYRRLLYWLGILKQNPQSETVWESVTAGAASSQGPQHSYWPLFTFIGLLFGGPYLISKFFSYNSIEPKWDPKKGTFYKASCPYEAGSATELSFAENEVLNFAPAEMQLPNCGWLLAANQQGQVGYVPANRLTAIVKPPGIIGQERVNQGNTRVSTNADASTNSTQ